MCLDTYSPASLIIRISSGPPGSRRAPQAVQSVNILRSRLHCDSTQGLSNLPPETLTGDMLGNMASVRTHIVSSRGLNIITI